jgi:2-keto-4-pentenoate hydratase/2-oxohepta-3-ene-1,7-dioic acid hydratase in catechol pathway
VLKMAGDVPEEWHKLPVHWKGNPDTVFGPEDEVPWPAYTEKLDFELELGAVVGRRGRPRDVEEAAGYIAGYTIFNDWSARDVQLREMSVGIGPGIGKDFATSLGPCIATVDEFDFDGARLTARVNGERWSDGAMGPMRFSFAEVLVHLAQAQELRPGDVIGSGTVGGGCGMELDRWLVDGDLVELEVDGIGVLRNRVVRNGAGPEDVERMR